MKIVPAISLLALLISIAPVCLADNPNAAKSICGALKNFTVTHPGLTSEYSIPLTISYANFKRHNDQVLLTQRGNFHFFYQPSICQTDIDNEFHSTPGSYSQFKIMLDNVPLVQGTIQPD